MDDAANLALIAYLAECLASRRSDIRIVSVAKGRHKRLDLGGDAAIVEERLRAWIGGNPRMPWRVNSG